VLYLAHRALGGALGETAVQSAAPTIRLDDPSRVLRNGLAVVGFASVEGFVRLRAREALAAVSAGNRAFASLPKGLRRAATEGALRAALAQSARVEDWEQDGIPLLQGVAQDVASTRLSTYDLSHLSLGYGGSNVSQDEVKQLLAAVGVKDAWSKLTVIAARSGAGSLPMQDYFVEIAKERHRAAHELEHHAERARLDDLFNGMLAFALAFDVLLAAGIRNVLAGQDETDASDVHLAFYRVTTTDATLEDESGTTIFAGRRQTHFREFITAACGGGAALVVHDASGRPMRWYT
jgi:hypothetical protein